MLNTLVFMGRLTRDPEFQFTPNGTALCKFTLVQDKPGRNEGGEKEAIFLNIVAWRKTAEFARDFLCKGKPIIATGRLNTRNYVKSDGEKGVAVEMEAEHLTFVLKDSTEQNGHAPADQANDTNPDGTLKDDPFGDE